MITYKNIINESSIVNIKVGESISYIPVICVRCPNKNMLVLIDVLNFTNKLDVEYNNIVIKGIESLKDQCFAIAPINSSDLQSFMESYPELCNLVAKTNNPEIYKEQMITFIFYIDKLRAKYQLILDLQDTNSLI